MSLRPAVTKLDELRGKLYSKAKTEPAFRFYALYDKVCRWDVLTEALRISRERNGAPGVDGLTFDQIREYGEERWLQELQRELQEKTYRPQPVRRVLIPKPGGGERPLGIPTIKDRVAQTAAKLILEPIFEADLNDAAHGYRPGRSAVQAVQKVHQELRRRRTKVVDADLSKYFDTIPHAELMTCLARRMADTVMLHLVKMWLKVPVEERDKQRRRRYSGGKRSKCGTPQGGVISPLLANIYINRMLKAFAKSDLMKRCGARIVNYADDFVVLCEHSPAAVLVEVRRWIVGMKLELNEAKTCLRNAWKEPFRFLGYEFGPLVYRPTRTRYLGARPSKQAMEKVRQRVSEILWRGRTERWPDICRELNQYLTGWAAYFAYDTAYPSFRIVDIHVAGRARNFLRRRHKLPSGTARFGYVEVHRGLGVVEIRSLLRSNAPSEICPGAGCGQSARPVR
ncbi:MAG: group II intron reverse transcriptase/maturase [Deltaproteobacteria bacterium]